MSSQRLPSRMSSGRSVRASPAGFPAARGPAAALLILLLSSCNNDSWDGEFTLGCVVLFLKTGRLLKVRCLLSLCAPLFTMLPSLRRQRRIRFSSHPSCPKGNSHRSEVLECEVSPLDHFRDNNNMQQLCLDV